MLDVYIVYISSNRMSGVSNSHLLSPLITASYSIFNDGYVSALGRCLHHIHSFAMRADGSSSDKPFVVLSRIDLIRPPMIGIMEPPGSGDFGVSDGACS